MAVLCDGARKLVAKAIGARSYRNLTGHPESAAQSGIAVSLWFGLPSERARFDGGKAPSRQIGSQAAGPGTAGHRALGRFYDVQSGAGLERRSGRSRR